MADPFDRRRMLMTGLALLTLGSLPSRPGQDLPTAAQMADYLDAYATRFEQPILLDTRVTRLERLGDRFAIHTSQGLVLARQVVVATGPFQTSVFPGIGADLGSGVR
ncbi:NAD(P)-binding domain-containing protein [Nocardioides sp. MAHUQ-72]|uniref:NAD(P)-binding domain-containing protein n=1 Tax=unclassified Nocardioides TaxID=2615069 RepID=UPI0036224ACD